MTLPIAPLLILIIAAASCIVVPVFVAAGATQSVSPLSSMSTQAGADIQVWANMAVVVGVPVAIALAYLALRQLRESRAARHAEITLRLFEYYQSNHMRDVMDYIRKPELKGPDGTLDFHKLRADKKAEKCLYDLGNFFEIVAILAGSGQWDPGAAATLFGEMLKQHWRMCQGAVKSYRQHQKYDNLWKPWETFASSR